MAPGVSVRGRTSLAQLLLAVTQNPRPFEYVLIDDTSRLSRRMGEVESIIGKLRFYGVSVFFVSQGIDSRDNQSHLTVGVNSLIDSQYRRDLASKTLRGMEGQALKGYNAGGRAYGFSYTKEFDPAGSIDRKTGFTRVIGSRRPRSSPCEIFHLSLGSVCVTLPINSI
ncbi:MAG: recombinase family protein [bacterium]|nr:recombinase family protein [bacterium]